MMFRYRNIFLCLYMCGLKKLTNEIKNKFFKTIDCVPGFYGDDCEKECGKCKNGAGCNRTTGLCPNGCREHWVLPYCKGSMLLMIYHNNDMS